jgi:hypothetical protein
MPRDEIDRWLSTFSALVRLPEVRRSAVVDELEDHLRCRTRDLMIAGASEHDSVQRSIAELGEAAELATRFRRAAAPSPWRPIMSVSIIGLSAAALTLSVIAIAGSPRQEAARPSGVVFRSPAPETTSDSLADVRLRLDMQEAPITDFFARAGEAARTPVFAHWEELPVSEDDAITVQVGEVSFATALRLVNMRLGRADSDTAIDFRQRDGVLEFASRSYFDRQEADLVRYDLAPLTAQADAGEIADLITALVDPHSWEANGGTTASLQIAGDQMFVMAPKRMLPKLEWILAQFAEEAEAEGAVSVRATPLQHTVAAEVATIIEQTLAPEASRITPDVSGNALIISAPDAWQQRIARLIALLDTPAAGPVTVRFTPLRNSDAASVAGILGDIIAAAPGVSVTPDPRTNALIVSATADWHDRVEQILLQLDADAPPGASVRATALPTDTTADNQGQVVVRCLHPDGHSDELRAGSIRFIGQAEQAGLEPAPR